MPPRRSQKRFIAGRLYKFRIECQDMNFGNIVQMDRGTWSWYLALSKNGCQHDPVGALGDIL